MRKCQVNYLIDKGSYDRMIAILYFLHIYDVRVKGFSRLAARE